MCRYRYACSTDRRVACRGALRAPARTAEPAHRPDTGSGTAGARSAPLHFQPSRKHSKVQSHHSIRRRRRVATMESPGATEGLARNRCSDRAGLSVALRPRSAGRPGADGCRRHGVAAGRRSAGLFGLRDRDPRVRSRHAHDGIARGDAALGGAPGRARRRCASPACSTTSRGRATGRAASRCRSRSSWASSTPPPTASPTAASISTRPPRSRTASASPTPAPTSWTSAASRPAPAPRPSPRMTRPRASCRCCRACRSCARRSRSCCCPSTPATPPSCGRRSRTASTSSTTSPP